jgi:acyl-CoA thioesterase FadM
VVRETDGVPIASGHTVHAVVATDTLRPIRIPQWLRDDLARLQ